MPRTSIIIPTYNRDMHVVKAVKSILNQSYTDSEIIVVDDGSTDNTRNVLNRYENEIKYIYQNNTGVSSARNMGIMLARGEWLAFLDSDDEWRTNYLQRQMEEIAKHNNVVMQSTDCAIYKGETRLNSYFEINGALPELRENPYLFIDRPFEYVVKHGPWQIGSTIVKRDAAVRAGLFDQTLRISEDYDFMARVAVQGSFGIIREELVNVHRRDESIVCLTQQAKENPIPARESDDRVFRKLLGIPTLSRRERNAVLQIMKENRSAIGNMHLKSGNIEDAREAFRKAIAIKPCARSISKYLLSLVWYEFLLQYTERKRT